MAFKDYFLALAPEARKDFATRCKTSVGHLNNCLYGYAKFSPALCVSIERESGAKVSRRDLRDDWMAIWPELVETKGKRAAVPIRAARA